ncbi:hypothetical protein [Phyllobacterium chamaecytisi]|uniref:hypothetical protein n=1 Tax=Phyllobacterium chamaecytisi TaxID=2876082 RepID=UPI001CCD0FAF|nr:hypothetical protein [Phyllobacterium sp. KW56]MBZ9600279.1 hypothetical protein [Phyllobacterium sp. KW56]
MTNRLDEKTLSGENDQIEETSSTIHRISLLSGCATPPGRIQPLAYASNCPPNAAQQLAAFSSVQQSAATNDALGVFLIGLPVASMSGGDHEAEIAHLKACTMGRGVKGIMTGQ